MSPRESPFEQLHRILAVERQLGYTNKSIQGGLARFSRRWESQARESTDDPSITGVIETTCRLLKLYPSRDPEDRALLVDQMLWRWRLVRPGEFRPTAAPAASLAAAGDESAGPSYSEASQKATLVVECPGCGLRNIWDYDHLICRECKHLLPPPRHLDKHNTATALPHEEECSLPVTYTGGHRGTDFYLRHFWKGRSSLSGTLAANADGLTFSSDPLGWRQTVKTIRLPWSVILRINAQVAWPGFILRILGACQPSVSIAIVTSQRSSDIRFALDGDARESAERLQSKLDSYRQHERFREHLAQEHIADRRLDQLAPRRFEHLVKQLFEAMGYTGRLTSAGADGGVDLVLRKGGDKVLVQCKRYHKPVGQPTLRDLYGALQHHDADRACLVTTSTFTRPATRWAEGKPLELIDKYQLAALLDVYAGDWLPPAKGKRAADQSSISPTRVGPDAIEIGVSPTEACAPSEAPVRIARFLIVCAVLYAALRFLSTL